jgi:hypothetical protein
MMMNDNITYRLTKDEKGIDAVAFGVPRILKHLGLLTKQDLCVLYDYSNGNREMLPEIVKIYSKLEGLLAAVPAHP